MVELIVFNVGFGDCIHVSIEQSGKRAQILIDTGTKKGIGRIANEIIKIGKQIDYIILTHEHSDHCGGLLTLLEDKRFVIKGIILNLEGGAYPGPSNSDNIKKLYKKAINNRISVMTPEHFWKTNLFISENVKLLYPTVIKQYFDNPNRNSIVIAIKDEDNYLLLMGDATKSEEQIMLKENRINYKDVKFIKIGHHGSQGSTSNKLLEAIKSSKIKVIACSCKASRTSPPPHQDTLVRINTLRTSLPDLEFKETGKPVGLTQDIRYNC